MAAVLVGIYSRYASWNIPAAHVERLRREFPEHTFLHAGSEAEAHALIREVEIAFMSEVRPAQFAEARRLRWVHSPAAGVGGMLFPQLVESAVVMTNSRGVSAETIAEHVLAVTLALLRKLPEAVRRQQAREWAQDAMMAPPPVRTLSGRTALVVGLGSIGGAAAAKLAALGVEVTGVRRTRGAEPPPGVREVVGPDALHAALGRADIVVLAAPQTPRTRGLIDARALAAMRSDAVLVNVSRGRLVDERALADALEAGRLRGAALDVFEHEPLDPASPLWGLPNVLVTPHMSGFRPDHWEAVTDLFAENLRRFFSGAPLLNVVDKREGY